MIKLVQAKPTGPSWKQVRLLLGSAIVLGAGGCALFLNSSGDFLVGLGGSAFVVGMVLFFIGFVKLLIRLVRSIPGK